MGSVVVPSEVRARAFAKIKIAHRYLNDAQSFALSAERPPKTLVNAKPTVLARVASEAVNKAIAKLVEAASLHPVSSLATSQLPSSSNIVVALGAAIVAQPPQVTVVNRVVKPWTYINRSFFVIREGGVAKGNTIQKVVSTMIDRLLEMCKRDPPMKLPDKLEQLYLSKVKTYRERGKSRHAARVVALKDALRIVIGNAWLVWVFTALGEGAISESDLRSVELLMPPVKGGAIEPRETFVQPPAPPFDRYYRSVSWKELARIAHT